VFTYSGDDWHENQRRHGVRHEGRHPGSENKNEDEGQPWIGERETPRYAVR